jgi:hypothetical protein
MSTFKQPEYNAWSNMKTRCYNSNYYLYHRYGGRGIIVCDEWKDSFDLFLKDMGARPSTKHSIDRKDNDGNYEPSNCRWATPEEQANNTRSNKIIEVDGVKNTLAEWCRIYNQNYSMVQKRLSDGMEAKKALTSKKGSHQPRYNYFVDGICYNTIDEIVMSLGVKRNTAFNRFKSDNFSNWVKKQI